VAAIDPGGADHNHVKAVCEQRHYPLMTLATTLDCPECGARSNFHFSPLPQSLSPPPGNQCDHPNHSRDNEILAHLEESYLVDAAIQSTREPGDSGSDCN
jgi:hypothetical protein